MFSDVRSCLMQLLRLHECRIVMVISTVSLATYFETQLHDIFIVSEQLLHRFYNHDCHLFGAF